MATYYVRPDGNNANAGTGPSVNQAWSTVAYAFANMALPDAVNTLYIAPGTYRESPTLSITPSVSNTLVVSGDPTAAQFSGVVSGRVRITAFTSDNTGTYASTAPTLVCDNKTYFTLQNLHVEGYQINSSAGIAHFINAKNYTIQNCLFSLYRRGATSNCVFVTTTTNTAINATFDKCIMYGGYACINVQGPTTSTAFNFNVLIKDCYLINGSYSSIITGPSEASSVGNGISFYNNILEGYSGSVYLRSSNTTNKTLLYNNALASYFATGINSSTNTVTEDYNRFSCSVDRIGPASGANSQQGIFGYDLDYSRLVNLYTLDYFGAYSGSIVQSTGTPTNAPTVDIFGQTWIGANPDVGAATFKIASSVGQYNPTERNASVITIAPGSTSQSIELYLGATGLTASTSGLTARYNRTRTASVAITLVARTIAQAWTSGGFAEVDATNMPGVYRLDLPDAALAAGADDVTIVVRGASGTNGAVMTVKLSSGGLTAAQTASAVWGASPAGYNDATTFGGVINETRNVVGSTEAYVLDVPNQVWDEPYTTHTAAGTFGSRVLKTTVDNRLVDVGTSNHIQSNVHAIVDSTTAASELSGALLHNGTDYISADLLTPITSAINPVIGPFTVLPAGAGADNIVDLNVGTATPLVLNLVDGNGAPFNASGSTTTATVYTAGGSTVTTYTGSIIAGYIGAISIPLSTAVTATSATYTMLVSVVIGTTTTVFGPLKLVVRAI